MVFSMLFLVLFALSTVYGIPSLIVYLYVIHVLIRDRSIFHSWFYKFFVINGILDCCDIIIQTLFDRIPFNGLFVSFYRNLPHFLVTVCFFFKYFHLYAHFIGSFVVGVNRFYAIVVPEHHHTVMVNRVLNWLSVCLIFCPSLGITVQLLYLGAEYVPFDEDRPDASLIMKYNNNNNTALPNFRNSENAVYLISVVAVLSLLFNGITLFFIIRTRAQVLSTKDKNLRKAEFNLFSASMMIFSFELLMVAYQAIALARPNDDRVLFVLSSIYPLVYDACMLTPPWILLATSATVRQQVILAHRLFIRRQTSSS